MKKKYFSAILISSSLTFFFPSSIKTQWHTNGFLPLSGVLAVAPNDLSKRLGESASPRHVLDYVALDLTTAAGKSRGYTFEARFFLDDGEAPATFMAVENSANGATTFRLRKESGAAFVAEFFDGVNLPVKLLAHKMIPSGIWLELAVVLERIATDACIARLYLNGERMIEHAMKSDWSWPEAARLYLGGAPGVRSFGGKMDEVHLSATARYRETIYEVPLFRGADEHTMGLWNFEDETFPSNAALQWRESESAVQFSSFDASRRAAQSVRLEWETSLTHGLEGFVIERRSAAADARFERCGFMPAMTNSLRSQTYHFVDATPTNEAYYYRLRVVAQNGDSGFSHEVVPTN